MFDLERIGRGLPVSSVIHKLPAQGPLVVEAPPGTGKTTLVPPAVANMHGKTLVTAPRRVAVRAAWRRLSLLDDPSLTGYSIRGEHSDGALVEFVTPGVLLNRLLRDPELPGASAVIIDEVHERQLDTDLVLAMCMELSFLRDDLFLAAMSATLNAQAFADHMGASVLSTSADLHPLEVTYAPHPGRAEGSREFYRHVADLAASGAGAGGDGAGAGARTLVFVPGAREVDLVCGFLAAAGVDAAPLHGRLSSGEQDAALNGDAPVVVSTAVAESSITVPGVRRVVDAGLSREPRRDARGMTGLVTVSESKASANQRAGRAARLGPGEVIRVFSEADYQHFRDDSAPEILTSDLTGAALAMHAWGSPDLPLLTPPPAPALAEAEATLAALGALEPAGAAGAAGTGGPAGAGGQLTELGRRLAGMPVDPRLGAALLKLGKGAAPTVAAIAEGVSGHLARAQAPKRQVERLARLAPDGPPVSPGEVVEAAFPQWVGKRVGAGGAGGAGGADGGDGGEYLLASGTRARLALGGAGGSGGMGAPEWIAAAEIQRTKSGAVIRAAAATELPADRITEEYRAAINPDTGKIQGRKVKAVGAIELSSTPVKLTEEQALAALQGTGTSAGAGGAGAGAGGTGLGFADFPLDEEEQQLKDRLDFLRDTKGWPDVSEGDYGVEVREVAGGASIRKVLMRPAMLRQLDWQQAAELDTAAPERLEVPSGSRPRIDYSTGRPVVRVKLQECFGLAQSPEVAGTKVLFHLLSPAGRELAVTDDLRSFWDGPYEQVRKEMRGRYPKHPWPEDPWTAQATARTKRRM